MRFIGVIMMLAVVCGCGHKGPVIPLGDPLPVAPAGFSAQQRGDTLLLSWEIPTVNQDGSRIDGLKGFEVLRMDFDGIEICDTCRDTARPLSTLDLDYLQGATRSGSTVSMTDSGIDPPRAYRYHVVALSGQAHRGARATLDVVTLRPPEPPAALQGEGLDRLVKLQWDGDLPLGEGETLLGFLIYRTIAGQPFPPNPLQSRPVVENRYEDLGVANDIPLRYAVRSVILHAGKELQSRLSDEITVTPKAGR